MKINSVKLPNNGLKLSQLQLMALKSRQDLLIRGPGELLGQRQSGLPALRFANLEEDLDILHAARDIAKLLVDKYPIHAKQLVNYGFTINKFILEYNTMHPNFKLLINNPILETANYISIKSEYINQCLSSYLYLPQITSRPFIFSCFALC